MAAKDALQPVLRYDAGCAGTDDGRLLTGWIANLVRAACGDLRQRLALPQQHVGLDAAGEDLVLEAPGAHELHRARAQASRPREEGGLHALLDEQGVDAVAPECDRRGEAGRTGADHEYVNFEGDLHRHHRNSIGHAVFQTTECLRLDTLSSEM